MHAGINPYCGPLTTALMARGKTDIDKPAAIPNLKGLDR